RGTILDRNGSVLATSRVGAAVGIIADDLPGPAGTTAADKRAQDIARAPLYRRLARVLGMRASDIRAIVNGETTPGYQPAVIQSDISTYARTYISERPQLFPGVVEYSVNLRDYPQGDIGSVVLGEQGPISKGELSSATYKGVKPGVTVGQSGLELAYQHYLQGVDGTEHVQVDAAGYPTGHTRTTAPIPGDELQTSIDLGLEREGYAAIDHASAVARHNGDPAGRGGFFAMDPFTGRVLAVGSVPTYDANDFDTPPSTALWARLTNPVTSPLVYRAVNSVYPTGSTFKPITALAALNAGLITASTSQGAGSCVTISDRSFCNSGSTNYGDENLVGALTVSEDTYFYLVGAAANGLDGQGHSIQNTARELGLGRSPGIDLGGGASGLIPDAKVRQDFNTAYVAQHCKGTKPKPAFAHESLSITACAQGYFYPAWTVGQNVGLATGQSYLQASPAQMAIAYSAIVNGGRVWSPRIGEKILTPTGQLQQELPPPTSTHADVPPASRALIMDGLHGAAQSPQGTSDAVFGNFPLPVYGKTGTAVRNGQKDQSWYVCYVPDGSKSIVLAVTIEQGGFGAAAAAPAARLMLSQWFGIRKQFVAGTSTDR
ncbi:MAG: penicillin-binding transpeptidase domain-containing protein, partial [Solirubrobacteraceae bacterium]